jgi:hypothetical protein
MFTKSPLQIALAGMLACLVCPSPAGSAGAEPALGRVLYSYDAKLGTVSVPKPETILTGDVMTTTADGSALVEFDSGARLKIAEDTSVRFVRENKMTQVQVQSGAVVSETRNAPTLVVRTPKYDFAPARLGDCRYMVRLSNDQVTTIAAIKGSVFIRSTKTNGSYLLHEGSYAVIDADSSDTPSQPDSTPVNSQPSAKKDKAGGWHIGSLSSGESVALAAGIAGGAAAAIAIPLTRSSTASPNASPSAP